MFNHTRVNFCHMTERNCYLLLTRKILNERHFARASNSWVKFTALHDARTCARFGPIRSAGPIWPIRTPECSSLQVAATRKINAVFADLFFFIKTDLLLTEDSSVNWRIGNALNFFVEILVTGFALSLSNRYFTGEEISFRVPRFQCLDWNPVATAI